MRHLCLGKLILLFLIFGGFAFGLEKRSVVVYYGDDISYPIVGVNDYIIVQPNINTYPHGFKLYKDKIYGYISVVEAEKGRDYYKKVKKPWIIGKNRSWNSKVMDISNKAYRDFLFKEVVEPMVKRGFKNFFLDTLDSYQAISSNQEFTKKMEDGLVEFIKEFKKRYPNSKLILNRGFEIIDRVHSDIEAVLFESLLYGLSSKSLKFKKVSNQDREWLLTKIQKIQNYNIPIIALEYINKNQKTKIKETIRELNRLNIIPYISFSKELDSYGVSNKKPIKRDILLIYDDTQFDGTDYDDVVSSTAYLQLSTPLEYMGFVPIIKPVTTFKATPKNMQRYGGVIIWLNGKYAIKHPKRFMKLAKDIYFSGVKMLILETLDGALHKPLLRLLGIRVSPIKNLKRAEVVCKKGYTGFEIIPFVPSLGKLFHPVGAKSICDLKTKREKGSLWAITSWGGFAREGVLLINVNKSDLWIANPFKLLKESLRLPDIPAPDPTTENGKRILFSHIDGDAIMSRVEWNPDKFDGETIYEDILKKYDIPISVSFVVADLLPNGLYPQDSKALNEIAKKMLALPNTEGATHTLTHPFFWGKITKDGDLPPKYRLKLPNYKFSIEKEIKGSLDYINKNLMPPDKEKAHTVFWSGDCLPRENALEYVHKYNILNINGGDTVIVNSTPYLSLVAPFGLKRGDYYQIHTGEQDENVYTNDWTGPFWGFRRAIQTFKLTDKPRRLKPIDIYFHFYSGAKRASLTALKDVFEWSIKQDVIPLFTSEYILKASDFFYVSLAKEKNIYYASGMKHLKTLRVKKSWFVDFEKSIGVVGSKVYLDSKYIHIAPNIDDIKLVFVDKDLHQNHLISANAPIKSFRKDNSEQKITFSGFVPLKIEYYLQDGCTLEEFPKATKRVVKSNIVRLEYEKKREATITIQCY